MAAPHSAAARRPGTADEVIPYSHGESLSALPAHCLLKALDGADHNDVFDEEWLALYAQHFGEFFAGLRRGPAGRAVEVPHHCVREGIRADAAAAIVHAAPEPAMLAAEPEAHVLVERVNHVARPAGELPKDDDAEAVFVGAGPVGLFAALQLKKRCPDMNVLMLEKYAE